VHLFGQAAQMDRIMKSAKHYGIAVIEDSAQAIGTEFKGKKVGSIGDLGCFSFFPTKNLGGFGESGLVISRREELADRVALLRNHGCKERYFHETVGGNFRIDALQASALRVCLPHLETWISKRQEIANNYDRLLSGIGIIEVPFRSQDSTHTFHQYTIRVKNGLRNSLLNHLNEKEIGNSIYYPVPCHLQKAVSYLGYKKGSFPQAENASEEVLSLPLFPYLTSGEQEHVGQEIQIWAKGR
jgi:dTDP-4-amino-4,6-dideoxygalactose transaminase